MKATVYTGPGCRACKAAIAWLKARGIEVAEKPHTEAPFEVWSLPVIVLGDEILTGFDPTQLAKAIRRVRP